MINKKKKKKKKIQQPIYDLMFYQHSLITEQNKQFAYIYIYRERERERERGQQNN